MPDFSRRTFLRGAAGVTGTLAAGGLAGCSRTESAVEPSSRAVRLAEASRRPPGQRTIAARLTPRPVTVDLGGRVVRTWGYGEQVPGPLLRVTAGEQLRVDVDNRLPTGTTIHWHGIALRNDMDGVPGVTQASIPQGGAFRYRFTVPDPGTYFYHPHSGVQLDRGLYGVLVVDDPAESGRYDQEWVVVLDDWVDGTGRTPDTVLARLRARGSRSGSMGGMPGMGDGMAGMEGGMRSPLLGGAGDVRYPLYLVNGRAPSAPVSLRGKPGQRVRIRVVNAGSDTAFRVAVGGHRMTVTHSDGFPVVPAATDAVLIGMGERYDVEVILADGAFPLVASAEGKTGQGLAVIRTGSGRVPAAARPAELNGRVLLGTDLKPREAVRLAGRRADRTHDLVLGGSMAAYRWTINGRTFSESQPLPVTQGERVRLRFRNRTMMFHPMHVHGHTFGVAGTGARKDTVVVRPMRTVEVELDADNPGQWATHCHNIYHSEAGMMTTLSYRA